MKRQTGAGGGTTLIEKPFPVEVDPGALVQRKR